MKKFLLTIPLVITALVLVVGVSISVIYTDEDGELLAPEIGDAPSAAELKDLQAVASQFGMSLQAAKMILS